MKIIEGIYFYKGRGEGKVVRGAGSCNVIVARGKEQVMVDTGLIVAHCFQDLERAAASDGIDLRQTRAILHTHAHWDHITGDCIVQGEYGAKVYAHPWEKTCIESQPEAFRAMVLDTNEFYKEILGLPPIFLKLLLWYLGGSYRGLRVNEQLQGGEKLNFGFPVEAVFTPGHCPGHMAYYFSERKVFAGGDLIDLETGTCVDLNNPHSDYSAGLASLEKVRNMDIEIFLPAHGEPVIGRDNVRSLLQRMIDNTRELRQNTLNHLLQREATLTDLFNSLLPNTPFSLKAMKMMQILAVLKQLQKEQKVTVKESAGKLLWRSLRGEN